MKQVAHGIRARISASISGANFGGAGSSGNLGAGVNSGSSSRGQGTIDRSERIDVNVAAVVTNVLPNGNLMISGSQEVRVNYEMRVLNVAGIVPPARHLGPQHHRLREDRGGAHFLRREGALDGGPAAGMGPAGLRPGHPVLNRLTTQGARDEQSRRAGIAEGRTGMPMATREARARARASPHRRAARFWRRWP